MARRLLPIVAVVVVPLLLLLVLGAADGSAAQPPATPGAATPTAHGPAPFVRELVGQVPRTAAEDEDEFVTMTRVTLAAGQTDAPGAAMADHLHAGPSVMFVESGAICYHAEGEGGEPATVYTTTKPNLSADELAAEVGCARPVDPADPTCAEDCAIETDGPLLLTAGESIAHVDTANHRYWAPGPEVAVVYISEIQIRDAAGPCTGGCH